MEIFSKDGMIWWVGVVENRNDPLKLGRCQVRIFGYHTEDTSLLPTSDLPWALPMQPITSAAISGKGSAPVGPLEGSWVVGWFLDGKEKQQPLMIGTIGGTQQDNPFCPITNKTSINPRQNYLKDSSGNIVHDNSGEPILTGEPAVTGNYITSELPPLKQDQIQSLMDAIGQKESSSIPNGIQNYSAENKLGYIGKYQFGASALIDLGYVKIGTTNSTLNDPNNWTGKDGIISKDKFLKSGNIQESIMFQYLKVNYKRLQNNKVISTEDNFTDVAGYLAAAHLVGSGNANKFDKKDGNGVKASTYFSIGNKSVGGTGDVPSDNTETPNRDTWIPGNPNNPSSDPTKSLNDPSLAKREGFRDPNKVYPTCEYSGKVDTNKLAVGDDTHKSIIDKRRKRVEKIPTAISSFTWSEPDSAFCAKYPYNQVIETEAGHVVELDNTPGKERIHVYHKSGSFMEIDVNGSMIRKVTGDNYEVMERNNSVYVKGGYNLTVDGATKILVRDNASIQVEGDTTIFGHNSVTIGAAKLFSVIADRIAFSAKNGISMVTDKDLDLQSATTNIKTSKAFNVDSALNASIHGKLALALDAAVIRSKMGHTAVSQLGDVIDPIAVRTPDLTSLPLLKVPVCDTRTFNLDELEPESEAYKNERLESGEITAQVPKESDTSDKTGNNKIGEECDCEEFQNYLDYPDTLRLSKYFTLGALTNRAPASNYSLQPARGLSKAEIACNLKNLAVNVLDPIKAKYSDMIVTSGLRSSSGDHGIGQAADLQFTKSSYTKYYEIAQWIRDNIPFKQLLLEYETRSSGQIAWIHIAYNTTGQKANMPIGTLLNHATYKRNTLANLA